LTTHTDQPPQAGSAVWQRFWELVEEHFETVCWNDDDGRPTLLTLIDLASGEALTLTPLDAMDTDPAAVLAVSAADTSLSARGPLAGSAAANDLTLRLAEATDRPTGAACPVLLHPPDQPHPPPQAWLEMPEPIARDVWGATGGRRGAGAAGAGRPRRGQDDGDRPARNGFRRRAVAAATNTGPPRGSAGGRPHLSVPTPPGKP
jgi:hypothetical protein